MHEYQGEYEVILMINCCVGLIITPKEQWYNDLPKESINLDKWGITPDDIDDCQDYSVQNASRHIATL